MDLKEYIVTRRFSVDVCRNISAGSMAEAEAKSKELSVSRFLRPAPGATLIDWENMSGTNISEERE